jgi:hypothetical protein
MADVKMLILDYMAAKDIVVLVQEELEVAKDELFEGLIQERMFKYINLNMWKIDDLSIDQVEAGDF